VKLLHKNAQTGKKEAKTQELTAKFNAIFIFLQVSAGSVNEESKEKRSQKKFLARGEKKKTQRNVQYSMLNVQYSFK
jgi:hypothetical protein